MAFADIDSGVTSHSPVLSRLTDEEFPDLCQLKPTLRPLRRLG